MEVINPSGNTVLIDSATKKKLIEHGDWPLFKLRQVPTIGTGPSNSVCLLLQDNGLGDHIHAMPAIKGLVEAGKDVTVYAPAFYAPLFTRLGVTVKRSEDTSLGFINDNLQYYGVIYSLSKWCIIHDEETEGNVTVDRFSQMANLVGVNLPNHFDWWDALFGIPYEEIGGYYSEHKTSGSIGIALQSSSVRRSYVPMLDVATEIQRTFSNRVVIFGGGPNARASKYMFEAKTIRELLVAVEQCALVIATDNGVLAVALALGIPTLAIFGPTNEHHILEQFKRYLSLENVHTLRSRSRNKECERPCSFQGRGFNVNGKCNANGANTFVDCLKEISVEHIVKAAHELYHDICN